MQFVPSLDAKMGQRGIFRLGHNKERQKEDLSDIEMANVAINHFHFLIVKIYALRREREIKSQALMTACQCF